MKITRRIRYYFIRLFRLKSSPHNVALGLTMGLLPSWLPTFGLGPILSVTLAKLVRGNKISALIGGIISTPIWPMLFFFNYRVGTFIFDKKTKVDQLNEVEYINNSSHSGGFLFISGAAVNIIIFSILIYSITYFLFKKYRITILNKIRTHPISS